MERVISATEARVHLGDVLRRVSESGEVITVERSGKPLAVLISIAEYEELQRIRQAHHPEPDWWEHVEQSRRIVRDHFAGQERPDINQIFDEMRANRDAQLLAGAMSLDEHQQASKAGSTDR